MLSNWSIKNTCFFNMFFCSWPCVWRFRTTGRARFRTHGQFCSPLNENSPGAGPEIQKKRQKHVQKWVLKRNHTFGRPAVAQRIASRLLFGGTNRRKESCFWHFFNCFWLHPWVFGVPLARFRCLAWLEIENPSCFLNKISYTLILRMKISQIRVDDLFCQKHNTF